MLVLKFGGTSVGSAERMRAVAEITNRQSGVVVVLSAMSGVTNLLVELISAVENDNIGKAKEYISTIKRKHIDAISSLFANSEFESIVSNSFEVLDNYVVNKGDSNLILGQGEIMSTTIFSEFLNFIGRENTLLYSPSFIRLRKDGEVDEAFISSVINDFIDVESDSTYVTQGFIASNYQSQIDNLNRGGSDYTASLIGAAINADAIEIWTDIDGFHNNDPRHVSKTYPIEYLSFDEAAELAYFGAKILHPSSIIPARRENIPVLLKNTMSPNDFGTLISNENTTQGVKAVAAKDGIHVIRISSGRMLQAHGFLKKVFEVFDKFATPIDVITTSEVSVSITVDNDKNLYKIAEELKAFGTIEIKHNCAILSVVGHEISSNSKSLAEVYQSLGDVPTHMISFGGSNNNITFVIDADYKVSALESLNYLLFNV
jgi:aspartate kinase